MGVRIFYFLGTFRLRKGKEVFESLLGVITAGCKVQIAWQGAPETGDNRTGDRGQGTGDKRQECRRAGEGPGGESLLDGRDGKKKSKHASYAITHML